MIGNFLAYSLNTSTAEYFSIFELLGLGSSESHLIASCKVSSLAYAVIGPPVSAKLPRHSAPFSTKSVLLVTICYLMIGRILLT
jgi:hypothetical protein